MMRIIRVVEGLRRISRGLTSHFTPHPSPFRHRGFPSPFTLHSSPSHGLRPYGFRLRPHLGKLGLGAGVVAILALSVGYNPPNVISVPARVMPFVSGLMNANGLLFDLKRPGLDILQQKLRDGFDSADFRDFLEEQICGNTNYTNCVVLDSSLGETKANDNNGDGHVLYYDTTAGATDSTAITSCPGGAGCSPQLSMNIFTNNHGTGHPNEGHFDIDMTFRDFYLELTNSILGSCISSGLNTVTMKLMIDPDKIDVNNINLRKDDPAITIEIGEVDIASPGDIYLCNAGACVWGICIWPWECMSGDCYFKASWACVEPIVEPMLAGPISDMLRKEVGGFLPMDLNSMFASEAGYSCPTYSGTIKSAAQWCQCGTQNDPTQDGYGYCIDCDDDGFPNVVLPAYNASIGESPKPEYSTLSCGDALINMGIYPHLRVENPNGVPDADDRVTMFSDFGCEVQDAALDIDPNRINVQEKLCKPTAAGCNGSTCTPADCAVGSQFPECCPAASYPRCCSLVKPTNPNGFACAVGQDAGNQIASAVAQSGLISCEVSKDGISTGLPIPMPIDMSQFLKVESFANLIPPIDDQADPGSYVKIRWRPYGDGNAATKEICAAIGGEPGQVYKDQGCEALCKENIPANAVYCSNPLNCCYPAGPVDINFSFKNIYTDFFIQVGGDPNTKAFGVSMDVGGALDMEFKTALDANRTFANKATFLTSGCNPLAGGTLDCLKVAIDPLDLMNIQFRYQDMVPADPSYLFNESTLQYVFPDVLVNLMGGAAQAWFETQISLAGLGFNILSAGADAGGWPDLDLNGKADYLTCTGNFAGTFDLIKLLDVFSGGSGGGDNPCAVDNPLAYARLAGSAGRAGSGQDGRPGRRVGALSSSSRATGDWRLATPLGGPETYIIHPFTGNPEASIQFVAEESRRASLIPEKPVRLQLHSVGSGVINYTWRLDRGVWRMTTEPVLQLPYLLEGTHLLEVQAVDGTGLADPTPASFIFQVDTQPPKIKLFGLTAYASVGAPGEDPVYFVDSNILRVEVSDFQTPFTHIKASYFLDGKEVKMTEPKMEIDPSKLSREQEHVLSVRATDVSGLESTREVRFTFRKEAAPPEDENFFGCESIPRPRAR